jgi:hypothetical protein
LAVFFADFTDFVAFADFADFADFANLADFADFVAFALFADFIDDARIADDFFVVFFADFFMDEDFFADLAAFFMPRRAVEPPPALRAAPPFFVDFDAGRLVRLGMTSPVL